jgi:hypothetical protein
MEVAQRALARLPDSGLVTSPRHPGRRTGVRAWVLAVLAVVGLLALGTVTGSAVGPPDAGNRVGVSAPETIFPVGAFDDVSAVQRRGPPASHLGTAVATGVPANAGTRTVEGVGQVTAHGAERVAGASATRGGVLSAEQIVTVRTTGQLMRQVDGATVRVLENGSGRFDVVVDGQKGLITTFQNLSENSLIRLSNRYGWTSGE